MTHPLLTKSEAKSVVRVQAIRIHAVLVAIEEQVVEEEEEMQVADVDEEGDFEGRSRDP